MWSFFWISIDPAGAAGHKKVEQMNIGKSLFLLACITCLTVSPLSAAQKGAVMTVKEGSKVTFDYVLKVDDQVVDTSEGGKPFTYTQGAGNIIPGLEKQLAGMKVGDKTFKVHIDGYDFLAHITGQEVKGPRPGFVYFSDDGDMVAVRFDNWKVVFAEQRVQGTAQIWAEPFVFLRFPKLFNLRTDPFERADITSNTYFDWMIDRIYLSYGANFIVQKFLSTFNEFPPRMKPASFTIDQVLSRMEEAWSSKA